MAVNRADAPAGNGASGADREPAIIVERLSKAYPTSPVSIFPPVTSVFDRDLNPFRRRKSSDEPEESPPAEITTTRPARSRESADDYLVVDDYLYQDDDDDDEDDEDDDDLIEEGSGRRTPWEPGEMFWALKDVSFSVAQGAVVGVVGGPGAGKSTLLGILGGRIFPTEGRAFVRDPVSPVAQGMAKALGLTNKGTFDFELVLASRLLGVDTHLVKSHLAEIEAMAAPLWDEEGEPARGALQRLGLASAIILPSNIVLIDEMRGVDPAFMQQVIDRIPDRVRAGNTVVLASRDPDLVSRVCDEAILLHDGTIAEAGSAAQISARHPAGPGGSLAVRTDGLPVGGTARGIAPGRYLSDGRPLNVPVNVPPFNSYAALLGATLRSESGRSKRVDAAGDEITLQIHFETARSDIEANCGVVFTPRNRPHAGIRVELPASLRFLDPRTYVLTARIPPGTLPDGPYEVSADAVLANPDEPVADVIARDMGRVRFDGEEAEPVFEEAELGESAYVHWDGRLAERIEAEWSID